MPAAIADAAGIFLCAVLYYIVFFCSFSNFEKLFIAGWQYWVSGCTFPMLASLPFDPEGIGALVLLLMV